jgi:hypothetical protein
MLDTGVLASFPRGNITSEMAGAWSADTLSVYISGRLPAQPLKDLFAMYVYTCLFAKARRRRVLYGSENSDQEVTMVP